MLLPQLFLFGHDDVQLVLLSSDVGLYCTNLGLKFLSSCDFVVEIGGISACLSLVLL